jgi:nucleotide-binding universal stress UspA family protein
MMEKKISCSARIFPNTPTPHSIVQWIRQKDTVPSCIFSNVLLPLDPCGYSNAAKAADPGQLNGSADPDDDLVQQTTGALKLKYKDLFDESIQDFEFVVKVGTPDVEVINYAKQNNIDMIILGALGIPEKDRATRIRTAANVSKFAPCQVIVIQKNSGPNFGI